jgi:hypothetical protein
MNCCDDYGQCNQGRDCPVRAKKELVFAWVVKFLAIIGLYAVICVFIGYAYASIPLVKERTCTPYLIDRIFK